MTEAARRPAPHVKPRECKVTADVAQAIEAHTLALRKRRDLERETKNRPPASAMEESTRALRRRRIATELARTLADLQAVLVSGDE
jgi:hypothetical protein